MIEIKLHITAQQGIEISHELETKGYKKNIHYDFMYNVTKWDPISYHQVEQRHVVFQFHDEHESLASWFRLRYE